VNVAVTYSITPENVLQIRSEASSESFKSSMKMTDALVARQFIGLALKIESCVRDAARNSADNRAEICAVIEIGIELIESKDNVINVTINPGCEKLREDSAVGNDLRHQAARTGDRPRFNRLSGGQMTEAS